MSDYAAFIARKQSRANHAGRDVTTADVHPMLHLFGEAS